MLGNLIYGNLRKGAFIGMLRETSGEKVANGKLRLRKERAGVPEIGGKMLTGCKLDSNPFWNMFEIQIFWIFF